MFKWFKSRPEPKAEALTDIDPNIASLVWGCIKTWEEDVSKEIRLWIQIIQWAYFLGWIFTPLLGLAAAVNYVWGIVPVSLFHLLGWAVGLCGVFYFGGRYNQYYYLRVEHNAFSRAAWFLGYRLIPVLHGRLAATPEEQVKLCQTFNDLHDIYKVDARSYAREIAIESIRKLPKGHPWPEGQARLTPEFDLQAAPNLGRRPKTPD